MGVRLPIAPPWETETPELKAPTENEPTELRLSIAGENALVPIGIGYCPDVPAIVPLTAIASDGGLVVLCVWMLGEIGGVQNIRVNGNPITDAEYASISATHYTGTVSQGVDPTMADAVLNTHGTTYVDDYVLTLATGDKIGVAYSVFNIPADTISGTPTFKADINGLKLWNVAGTAKAYSNNPALATAHFVRDEILGRGANIDQTSLQTVVTDCATTVGGLPRRTIGLMLTSPQKVSRTIETLRNYADCLVWDGGGTGSTATVYFSPATAGTSSATLTQTDMVEGSFKPGFKENSDPFTVAVVNFTDLDNTPATRYEVSVALAEVATKQTYWTEKRFNMPGIQDYAEAWRYGQERLNNIHDAPGTAEWLAPDEAIRYAVGDVVTVTEPDWDISAVEYKITMLDLVAPGEWRINADQFDSGIRSNATPSKPVTIEVITPPNPESAITTPVTGFVIEQVNATNTDIGDKTIHLDGEWNPSTVPNIRWYRVSITSDDLNPTWSESGYWSHEDTFPLNHGTATNPNRSDNLTPAAVGKTYRARIRIETGDGTYGPFALSNTVTIADPWADVDGERPFVSQFTASTTIPFAIDFRWTFLDAAHVALSAVEVYVSSSYATFNAIPGTTYVDKWNNLNSAGKVSFPGTYLQLSGSLGLQSLLPGMTGYAYLRGIAKDGRYVAYPIHAETGTPDGSTAAGVVGTVGNTPAQVQPVIPAQTITPELIFDHAITTIFAAAASPFSSVGTSSYVTISQFNLILPADIDWSTVYGYTFEGSVLLVGYNLPFSSYQGDRACQGWTRLVRTTGGGHTHAALNTPLPGIANTSAGLMLHGGNRIPTAAVEDFGLDVLSGTTQTFQLQARMDMVDFPSVYPSPRECRSFYWKMTVHRK